MLVLVRACAAEFCGSCAATHPICLSLPFVVVAGTVDLFHLLLAPLSGFLFLLTSRMFP